MNVYLLRHGIAEDLGPKNNYKDADRALTEEGRQKMAKIAKAMLRLEVRVDRLLSSPYRRAQQTAEIVWEQLECREPVELTDHLLPGANFRKLVENLRHSKASLDSVLLVGHEPDLSAAISLLVFGDKSSLVTMKKGGLCKLVVSSLRDSRCSTLEWLLTPKQMCLIA